MLDLQALNVAFSDGRKVNYISCSIASKRHTINSKCALSLDSQQHPAIYWAKYTPWERSFLQDICVDSQNG